MEETTDPQKRQQMEVVLENVYRISQTIRGLLDFARPAPPRFTRVNLNQVVKDTLAFLSHQPIFKKSRSNRGSIRRCLPSPPISTRSVRF